MLVQFSVRNFKTFRDKAVLSLVASNYDKHTLEAENVVPVPDFNLRITRSAMMYGANASGKSKFFEALAFMRGLVINSSRDSQKGDAIQVTPFLLDVDAENDSTEFEVIFIFSQEMFRYGFEVDKHKVIAEWLYHKPKTKEVELFYRDLQHFDIHKRNFTKAQTLVKEDLVRDNALLLSVAAQFNDLHAGRVLDWFKGVKIISGLEEDGYQGFTIGKTGEPGYKKNILELIKAADLGIQDITPEPLDVSALPKHMPKELKEMIEKQVQEGAATWISDILTTHKKYDSNKEPVGHIQFSLDEEESSGTKKFFALTGPVLHALENGLILVIDELDSKLHPNLVDELITVFHSPALNPNNAQLIFNTHNTHLLVRGLFRRDQIWFTEKDRYGAAKLYSLADFEVRKTENFEENYLRGKYGAVPFLSDFKSSIPASMLVADEG